MNVESSGGSWYWTLDDGAGGLLAFSPFYDSYEAAKNQGYLFTQLINKPVLFKPIEQPPFEGAVIYQLDNFRATKTDPTKTDLE